MTTIELRAQVPEATDATLGILAPAEQLRLDTIGSRIDGLQELWSETTGDARICVAVLDGPVDLTHPCYHGAALETVETLVPCAAGDDLASRHGTHVASVIFGQHGSAIAGIAPGCRGLIVPIYASQPGAAPWSSRLRLLGREADLLRSRAPSRPRAPRLPLHHRRERRHSGDGRQRPRVGRLLIRP